ncbi:zinc ribbon domain-containing protein, partial [Clostridioides difficile]|uniref:zinc ribbon domain-containing protein n=1 Tax=Clostridioides difficile TaxID=1496 RepID=UPI00117A1DC4
GRQNGRQIVKVGRFFASSQLCNKCGYTIGDVTDLHIRECISHRCSDTHDRNIRVSIMI